MTDDTSQSSRTDPQSNRAENRSERRAENRTESPPARSDGTTSSGRTRRVKDIDHTSPVEGPARAFERNNEGQSAKTDGGRRANPRKRTGDAATTVHDGGQSDGDEEGRSDGDEEPPAADPEESSSTVDRPRRRVKDIDHTSPVDGHVRVFGRGDEADDASQ